MSSYSCMLKKNLISQIQISLHFLVINQAITTLKSNKKPNEWFSDLLLNAGNGLFAAHKQAPRSRARGTIRDEKLKKLISF